MIQNFYQKSKKPGLDHQTFEVQYCRKSVSVPWTVVGLKANCPFFLEIGLSSQNSSEHHFEARHFLSIFPPTFFPSLLFSGIQAQCAQ